VPDGRPNTPLLVFDGDCAFCTSSARWIERRFARPVSVVPWQRLDLGPLGLADQDVVTAAWWVDTAGRTYRGHRAIAQALRASRGGWRWAGALIDVPPVSWMARAVYWLVARYRHRLPGGTPACRLG